MNNWNVAILMLAVCAGSAAQDYRGAVLGRVTDPSGAAVAGAKVAAVNEATNTVAAAQTAADGAYLIPFLIPGRYRVEVEASGFQKYAQSGITVSVNSQVRVDVTLQVGAITESVTVTADAPPCLKPPLPPWARWWTAARSRRCRLTGA
jgi:hypothetical protein